LNGETTIAAGSFSWDGFPLRQHFVCGPIFCQGLAALSRSLATRPAVAWLTHGRTQAELRSHVALRGGPTSPANNEICAYHGLRR
jgi:hypothetical protein